MSPGHFHNMFLMLAGQTLTLDQELTLFIRDALRFISAFIIPISQSAPHIYVSALSFAPEQSLIGKKFCSRLPNTVVVTEGKPNQWPMAVFTAEHHEDPVCHMVFSSNESTFASISGWDPEILHVCDSETGHCISGPFELPRDEDVCSVCFSPDGKHILLKYDSHAVVLDIVTGEEQFRIKGRDFVFNHHDGRIASVHWIDEDGNFFHGNAFSDFEDERRRSTGILVMLWDASNGAPISNRLFEVNDIADTRFSPDGHFLAVGRMSESVIELWNLEDGKDRRRFLHPPGNFLLSLHFSPTSDSLMATSWEKDIYLWGLDRQEMASFNHDFDYVPRVIHSSLTNYVYIKQDITVDIWDISMTCSKQIWETNPPATSNISSICPSWDGRRLLVGCDDGSVRMWELDLENLAMNQADTMDTQADVDMPEFIAFSHSGNMVATISGQSHIEFSDTTTGEVVSHRDIDKQDYDSMRITFSPDENQVAFLSRSLITICNTVHPNNRVSFNPRPRKGVRIRKVAFQTRNDLVICASDDDSALVQVWHRQDLAGFKCTFSLDLKVKEESDPFPAPDGLTVVIVPRSSSAKCYSWNHDSAQFHPIDFGDQVHISLSINFAPVYSPDGDLFACWSDNDSHVRVWDTRTGRRASEFRTSKAYAMALSPNLIQHSPNGRLIALKHDSEIGLYDVYTGHLNAKILDQGSAVMAFIRDGTKLAQYSRDFGLRIWDIADLTDEHWHSAHGYEPMLRGMRDGWVMGQDNEPLFWVPVEHRKSLCVLLPRVVLGIPRKKETFVDLSNSRFGRNWTECINKEWLREVEQKEKEVGNLLEKVRLVHNSST